MLWNLWRCIFKFLLGWSTTQAHFEWIEIYVHGIHTTSLLGWLISSKCTQSVAISQIPFELLVSQQYKPIKYRKLRSLSNLVVVEPHIIFMICTRAFWHEPNKHRFWNEIRCNCLSPTSFVLSLSLFVSFVIIYHVLLDFFLSRCAVVVVVNLAPQKSP